MSWRLGPYRVDDKPFAAGATAEVFAARKGRTGERVAVKVLPLRTFRERAANEASVATIDHPRLLAVRDSVIDERRGVVGLVMDLAAGGDLRAALRGPHAPAPIEMVQIVDDVLAALETLHGNGMVHRDIKPENVMLDRTDGQLRGRLGDMGIARPIDRTRSTGSVLGTDLYIAPEVHDGALPSPAADLWAVGYVLYEGLFGAPPHADATTTYQAIGRLRAEGPDRPPNVPDAIWHVVATLLAPLPEDRPASATAARALLQSARPAAEAASIAGAPVASPAVGARRPSNSHRTTAWTDNAPPRPAPYERKPVVARSVAAAAAVVLVVAGLAWVGGRNTAWFDTATPTSVGATKSLTPMPPASDAVVPTQYRWQLRNGTLVGRLDVSNPTDDTSPATVIPELFPVSAVRGNTLPLVAYDGPRERQADGSVLVQFEVPPLAPRAHHVVAFRLQLSDAASDRVRLQQLVRDRDAAIARHAMTLSEAPTLARLALDLAPSLTVGQRAAATVTGSTPQGDAAPAELLKDVRLEVIGAPGVVDVDGLAVVASAPGTVVVRAIVGDLYVDTPLNVVAPAVEKPRTTTTRERRPSTTVTTIWEEEAPPPAPKDIVI